MTALPYVIDDCSARLLVRLTPRAKRDELSGLVDAGGGRVALAIRLAARPVEGAANRALIAFLADRLDLPKSAFTIASGEKSRVKTVRIVGAGAEDLAALV